MLDVDSYGFNLVPVPDRELMRNVNTEWHLVVVGFRIILFQYGNVAFRTDRFDPYFYSDDINVSES